MCQMVQTTEPSFWSRVPGAAGTPGCWGEATALMEPLSHSLSEMRELCCCQQTELTTLDLWRLIQPQDPVCGFKTLYICIGPHKKDHTL